MAVTVGIVVRTRGHRALLTRALRSIAAQTHAEWRLIVVSADGTRQMADEVAGEVLGQAGEVEVISVDANSAERANAAFRLLDTDLLVVHDDNGSWAPTFLTAAVQSLADRPGLVAVAGRSEVVTETWRAAEIVELRRQVLAADTHEASLVASTWSNYIPSASLVFTHAALDVIGGYDVSLDSLEDWDFLLRLLSHGTVGFIEQHELAAVHTDLEPLVPAAAELAVRDRYLRRDLDSDAGGVAGLGTQMAVAHQVRGLSEQAQAAWAELSDVTDRWGNSHQRQLDVVSTDVRLEIGRLRGEMLLLREMMTFLHEDLSELTDLTREFTKSERRDRRQLARSLSESAPPPAPPTSRWRPRRVAGALRRRVRARVGR